MRAAMRLMLVVVLTGCTSYGATNSPVTDKNTVEVPELVGRWMNINSGNHEAFGSDSACLVIEPLKPSAYRAILDGCPMRTPEPMLAEFTRLGGELFAVTQQEITDTAVDVGGEVLALYSFYRLRTRNDSLFIGDLDADSLRTYLVAHPAELPFALLEGNGPDVLLTATSEQLAQFLATHARDSAFWPSDSAPEGWWARVH